MVGASRGLGRGIAVAFAEAGAPVVARHRPQVLVVAAGAVPHTSPLQHQTWETFSTNWHADVRIAFTWLRQVLPQPMSPGSRIVVVSSGAAINSSPISAGYAGAKATQRFIVSYAQDEADRAGLGITITTLMPRTTPLGDVGLSGVRAYSARSAQTEEMFVDQLGPLLTPEIAGSAVGGRRTDPVGPDDHGRWLRAHGSRSPGSAVNVSRPGGAFDLEAHPGGWGGADARTRFAPTAIRARMGVPTKESPDVHRPRSAQS